MTDAAIAAYGEVLAADPANVAAYRNVGEVLLAAGRIDGYLANFLRFEARCPDALPLAVQALVACQHQGDFASSSATSTACGTSVSPPRNEAELVDALEELLYLLLYFDVEPRAARAFRADVRRGGTPHLRRADGARAHAAPGARAHRLPFGRPAQSRHGQDGVGGGRAPRQGALRALLLLAVGSRRRMDGEVSRARRPLSRLRARDRARGGAAHRGGRSRHPGRPFDAHEGRAARHPRAEAGARADHARRERGNGGPLDDRFQAHRRLCRRSGEPGLPDRDAAADGGLRLSVSSRRAGGGASVSPRRAGHCRRCRRDRRLREPDEAVAPLPHAVARRARAYPAARLALSPVDPALRATFERLFAAGGIGLGSLHVPAAGTRRRREPGPLRRSSTSCSTRCPMAASTARSKRSTWACPS